MKFSSLLVVVWAQFGAGVVLGESSSAEKAFAKQDQKLNEVYQAVKAELEPRLFSIVQEDQRSWIQHRDYISEWQGRLNGEEGEDESAVWEMAAGLTEDRVEWLEAWLSPERAEGLAGRYQDSYGGLLEIVEKDDQHWFRLTVVRGPTFHIGDLSGPLRVNGSTAWFELAEEGEEPTWVTLVSAEDDSGRVRVVTENAERFCGMRAYFEGAYLWVAKLSAEEQAQVIAGER